VIDEISFGALALWYSGWHVIVVVFVGGMQYLSNESIVRIQKLGSVVQAHETNPNLPSPWSPPPPPVGHRLAPVPPPPPFRTAVPSGAMFDDGGRAPDPEFITPMGRPGTKEQLFRVDASIDSLFLVLFIYLFLL